MTSSYKIVNGRPTIEIGALRHEVSIQKNGPASPPVFDAGGPVLGWNTFATALAAIEAVRGTDVIKSGQTTTQLFLTVTMWWQPGILPDMRVASDNGSLYVIQSVENVLEMDVVLVLNCLGLSKNT